MTRWMDREALLAAHRPMLSRFARFVRDAAGAEAAGALVAYIVSLTEPTGYLIAAGLQERLGEPDPDQVLHAFLRGDVGEPVVVGVLARGELIQILAPLAPTLERVAAALAGLGPLEAPQVLVAAGGGAEVFGVGAVRGR